MMNFKGTGVALVTPFDADLNVDFKALESLVNHVITGGVDYLAVMGTTGETATLSFDEKMQILKSVIQTTDKRVPIIFGIGGNNTAELIKIIQQTDLSEVAGILSVSPYYNKPTQAGIYAHYAALAKASDKPIILYNVPGRTGSDISAETVLALANDFDNIVAVKEASGNFSQIMKIIQNKPENFTVISGDDALVTAQFAVGVEGVISVTANAFPDIFSDMIRAVSEQNFKRAKSLHYKLFGFTEAVFADGSPGGIKHALKLLNITKEFVRLPLVTPSNQNKELIKKQISEIKKD